MASSLCVTRLNSFLGVSGRARRSTTSGPSTVASSKNGPRGSGVASGSHAPSMTRLPSLTPRTKILTSVVFPAPASPPGRRGSPDPPWQRSRRSAGRRPELHARGAPRVAIVLQGRRDPAALVPPRLREVQSVRSADASAGLWKQMPTSISAHHLYHSSRRVSRAGSAVA